MVVDIPAQQLPIVAFELLVIVAGLVLFWVFQFGRKGVPFRLIRLPFWPLELNAFLIICLQVLFGSIMGAIALRGLSSLLPKPTQSDSVFMVMLTNLGLHLGAVAAALLSSRSAPAPASVEQPLNLEAIAPRMGIKASVVAGVITFAIAVALISAVSLLWQYSLDAFGVPAEKQELLDIFGKTQDPVKLLVMSFIAVVVAPLAEELTFRAGLFRFLRSRIPRWLALSIPAAIFAGLHWNLGVLVPLFALGLLFSVAYERTGRIWVTVLAHGLFNLNTIVLVLLKVNL